ncbi:MAG TPA: nuclear transport factor 2 family protein [Parafilimonas sp.]|nr:nuclear transport factor 2 family protein [Parafilimonas sp.]
MKPLLFLVLTMLYLNAFSQQSISVQPIKPDESIQQALLQKTQRFTEAWGKSDTGTLSKLLAAEYRHSDIWGKIQHKEDWLAYAAAPRKISDIVSSDVEILLYNNNTAVITGKMSYLFGEEKIMQEIRFTQLWTISEAEWKRTAFQATLIDKSK